MDNLSTISPIRSIRARLLTLLLGLTMVSVVVVSFIAVNSILGASRDAQRVSSETLRKQAEEFLLRLTIDTAERNDLLLEHIQQEAIIVAFYAGDIYANDELLASSSYWQPEDHMAYGPDGQFSNSEVDITSAFVPNFATVDDNVLRNLERSAYLDFILRATYESSTNIVAIYMGTEDEITRYYPNVNLGEVLPADFQVTQRPWYTISIEENNPTRGVAWSPVYEDATGQGLMVTAASPVYTEDDHFVGVIGIDLTLEEISINVEESQLLLGSYSFLLDESGRALSMPTQGFQDILGREQESGEISVDLNGLVSPFSPVLTEMADGVTGFRSLFVADRELFVAYAPLEDMGWSVATVIEASNMLQPVEALQQELEDSARSLVFQRILPIGGLILLLALAIGLGLATRMTTPINELITAARRIEKGDWDTPLPEAMENELGVLVNSFRSMTAQLRDLVTSLEQRVKDRTRDLERRAGYLEAASVVARDATTSLDLAELLENVTRMISDSFGFYHVGIFLIDENHEWAILQAASSHGGQKMLNRGHRLKVGEVGIVGYTTGTGEARIAADVGADAIYFDNPDMPETRSEMALPLRARGEIIGALDVQDTRESAFSEEDVVVLQTLADQVALAISNAKLFNQAQESLSELRQAYGEYQRQSWADITSTEHAPAFQFKAGKVSPVNNDRETDNGGLTTPGENFTQTASIESDNGARYTIPIKLYDKSIGLISIRKDKHAGDWSAEELELIRSLTDQLSLALENARIYQESQKRAQRERLVAETTSRLRQSLDIDTVLQTAAQELQNILDLAWAEVRIGENIDIEEAESGPGGNAS